MPDSPAVSWFEMDTVDPEQAHEWIARTYTEHVPRISGSRKDFRMRVTGAATERFRVDRVLHTMSVHADTEPFHSLQVNRVRAGRYRAAAGATRLICGPGDVTMMDTARPGWIAWDGLEVDVVALDLPAARSVAAELCGLAPEAVGFELCAPLDQDRARYWVATVDYVTRTVLGGGHDAAPLLRAEVFRALVTVAVTAFPNTALAALLDPTTASTPAARPGEPSALRRAVEFVDTHAHEDIGLTEIAAAARLGPRGLQASFRRHRDQTPLEYLRRVRLERAHRDLRDGDATRGDTVAAIAARWGFPHPGRFAAAYRRAYGCSPSDTLRR